MAAANIDDPDAVAEKLLEADLRFLDAHAYLASRLLGLSPQWALQHYEVGVDIGRLSVGDDFDGVLPGELAGNGAFLRCLSGYGSCLWQLERRDEAARVFERVLRLDPADRQGVRPLISAMRAGAPWSDRERS
jgi:tetratricopeptide (TPR) repeat protein